jgi:hypothetical protein
VTTAAVFVEDLTVKPGATLTTSWTWLGPDALPHPSLALVVGARAQFRELPWDAAPIVALTLGAGVVVDTPTGEVTMTLSSAQTRPFAALAVGLFDLLLDLSDGTTVAFAEGRVRVDPAAIA